MTTLRKRFAKAREVMIDFDSTPDEAHGQQAFAFFDGHYDGYTFKPLIVTMCFHDDPEQDSYLFSLV